MKCCKKLKSTQSPLKVVKERTLTSNSKIAARKSFYIVFKSSFFNIAKSKSNLTLAPIWLPHWPAWRWTISLIFVVFLKRRNLLKYHDTWWDFSFLWTFLVDCEEWKRLSYNQSEVGRAYLASFVRQLGWWGWVGGRRALGGQCRRALALKTAGRYWAGFGPS